MISQDTDGLSRRIWLSNYQSHSLSQQDIMRSIFDPAPYNPNIISNILESQHIITWRPYHWHAIYLLSDINNITSVWHPPPEIARQTISRVLEWWCEQPGSISALFIVPRTVPGFWFGLSKYVHEICTIFPHQSQLPNHPLLPIPIVCLFLSCHV